MSKYVHVNLKARISTLIIRLYKIYKSFMGPSVHKRLIRNPAVVRFSRDSRTETGYQRRFHTREGSQEPPFLVIAHVFNVYMCAYTHIH